MFMKSNIFLTLFALLTAFAMQSQNISLPTPLTTGGLPVNQALAERRSTREFSSRPLPMQTVADMLWATCGINRPADAHRTNPTAMNWQEVDAYLFTTDGVYRYDFAANELVPVVSGNKLSLLAGTAQFSQDYVLEAPAAVLLTVDTSKVMPGEQGLYMALVDAGIANENLNLFCAGNGLVTVPRATMDVAGLRAALNLPETVIPVINNPVGFPK